MIKHRENAEIDYNTEPEVTKFPSDDERISEFANNDTFYRVIGIVKSTQNTQYFYHFNFPIIV